MLFRLSQTLIMIKCIIFHKAMNPNIEISNFFTYKKFFNYFMSKIVDFIKLLPLDINFVNFYKKYFHFGQEDCLQNGIKQRNFRQIRKPAAELEFSCEIFLARFHLINSLNPLKLGLYTVEKMKNESINKFFQKHKNNISVYISTIIKIVKINGETDNFDDKIIACKDLLNVFTIEYTQMSDVEIYKQTIIYIYKHCLSDFSV